ncbi:MAG: replication initiation protein [Hyphomicrobiaceae bacterium]
MLIRDHHHPDARARFMELLPYKIYCTDDPRMGLTFLPREDAIKRTHIQLNPPWQLGWIIFDLDHSDARFRHSDNILPHPTFIAINRANGHAHAAYLLASPVAKHGRARGKPLIYFASVERGLRRRLGADPSYSGLIVKNPLHTHWDVEFRETRPFELDDLASWLWFNDMRPEVYRTHSTGAGRNVTLFDELRQLAYREILTFKAAGGGRDAWQTHINRKAANLNEQFDLPLGISEVRSTSKSVARWTWQKFNADAFSKVQANRGRISVAKRQKRGTQEARQPWKSQGQSRATYFRQKSKLQYQPNKPII